MKLQRPILKAMSRTLLLLLLVLPFGVSAQTTVTKTFTAPSSVSIDGCGTYCAVPELPAVDFTSTDFPLGCEITDVDVEIVWAKTDGTCTSPGTGNSKHSESNFRLDGPTSNTVLVNPGTYSGTGTISAVTTIFDQQAAGIVGGTNPVSGSFQPSSGDLNTFNGTSALGSWRLMAGDNLASAPMCISSYSVTITVTNDVTGPSITCPADQTGDVNTSCEFALPDYRSLAVVTDNCHSSPSITQVPAPGTIVGVGTTTVTLIAIDGNGNSSDCTFEVVVSDPVLPTAVCQDRTVYLDAAGLATIATPDIDGGSSVSTCGTLGLNASQTSFDCTDLGASGVAVTLTVDNGTGVSNTCVSTVMVIDTISPVAPTLSDITVSCGSDLQFPQTTDNCSGTITATTNTSLPLGLGANVVTWTFEDGQGNTRTMDQNITVEDISAPIPTLASLPAISDVCSVSLPVAPTAYDSCAGVISATSSAAGPWTVTGTYVIIWTYDDGNGNTSTQSQMIEITDDQDPVADVASLPDMSEHCSANPTPPTATDNCAGMITGVSDLSLPITDAGNHTITWTFDDGNGNVITQTQEVSLTGIDTDVTVSSGYVTADNAAASAYQWIDCSNMSIVEGATSQVFYPASNGDYAVILTENGCTDTSSCVAIGGVGIEDLDVALFNIYPNPTTSGNFTVDYEGEILSIKVVDMLGRRIDVPVDVKTGYVDGTTLSDGRYSVEVYTEERGMLVKYISILK